MSAAVGTGSAIKDVPFNTHLEVDLKSNDAQDLKLRQRLRKIK